MGATTIIAVDIDEEKLARAREHGATHTVNSSGSTPSRLSKEVSHGGFGADLVIDAVGIDPTFKQALRGTRLRAVRRLVGVPAPGTTWNIPLDEVFTAAAPSRAPGTVTPCPPQTSRVREISTCSTASIWDSFVSERISLEDVNEAFETMKTCRGCAGRGTL